MISKVSLKNWKSHLESDFQFTPGVNALVGIMGSGKSSVMDSICFALFGTFPLHNSRKIGLDDLIMNKPNRQEKSEIELDFLVNGNKYKIKRVIERGKGTTYAEIRENEKLLDISPTNVTDYVENLLKIDYSLFSRAIYSEQNNIDYFLTIPKGKRMQYIDEMLKVDRFERARESITKIKNNMIERKKEKLKTIKDLETENLEEKLKKIETELNEIVKREKEYVEELEKAKEEKNNTSKKLYEIENNWKELVKNEKLLIGIENSLKEIEYILSQKTQKLAELNLYEIDNELDKTKKSIKEFEEVLKSKEREHDEKREKISSLNTELRLITKEVRDILNLGNKCHVCESEINENKRQQLIKSRQEKEDVLRSEVNSCVKNLENLTEEVYDIKSSIKAFEKRTYELKNLLSEFDVLADLKSKVEKNNLAKADIENRIKTLKPLINENEIRNTREMLAILQSKEATLIAKISGLEQIEVKNKTIYTSLKERFGLLEKYRVDVGKTDKYVDEISKFVKSIELTQEILRTEFLKNVNLIMEKIWNDLYPYDDLESVRLKIDDDYILETRVGNNWVPVEMLSGGERTLCCLALRIAFSLAFTPNLKWLILDEPTHNLDASAISNFSYVLKDKISEFVKQVFLITHEDSIADFINDTNGSIYRLERDKKSHGATQVLE